MPVLGLVAAALLVSFLLIALLALSGKRKRFEREPLVTPLQFETLCLALLGEMKLKVEETERTAAGLDILAENPAPLIGGKILVRTAYLAPETVIDLSRVLAFSNLVLQEHCLKGIYITTGRFAPELSTLTELAPMEFIDGERLEQLIARYQIPKVSSSVRKSSPASPPESAGR